MLDPLSLFLGFVVGAATAGIALQLAFAPKARRPASEVTSVWDLASVSSEPRLLVESLERVRPPSGAKILVPAGAPHLPPDILATCEVRMHADVHENAVLGDGRALVFTSQVRPGALAISTRDPAVLSRLEREWATLWKDAEPFAPAVGLAEVPQHVGGVVEVRGVDAGMTEYRGRNVLRLESDGHALPVLVAADTGLRGQPVRVVGKVVRDNGLTYLDASRIVPLGRVPAVAVP